MYEVEMTTATYLACGSDSLRVAQIQGPCINYTTPNKSASLNDMDDESAQIQRVVSTVVPVFFGIIGLAGLLGNALVVLVVTMNPTMRSTTNFLIINLAAADLLFVIFCVPFTAFDYILPYWPFGDIWCKVVQYMIVVTACASVYTLVLMSLDRFLAVVHPVASLSLRTERNALNAIVLTWIAIIAFALPVAISHGEVSYVWNGQNNTSCVFLYEEYSLVTFQVLFFLLSYVVPLFTIVLLYVAILVKLWRGAAPGGRISAESRRGKKRATRMVIVVVLAFAICWLPIQLILVLKALKLYDTTHIHVKLQIVSHVLAYMNSCVNPVLYAFLSENFRKAFRKFVWCGHPTMSVGYNPATTNITKSTRTGNGTSNVDIL